MTRSWKDRLKEKI